MQSLKEVMKKSFPFESVGEKECEECGNVYQLFETPRGVMGGCKPCSDEKLKRDFNLPTSEDYKDSKEIKFILSFERVTKDLKSASVNGYAPKHETQHKAKQLAIEFIKGFDGTQSINFSGDPGLGKSHLAYAIAKGIRTLRKPDGKRYTALFIKTTDLLQKIRSTYSPKSNLKEERIFEMINELDLLVLDDVGSEYVKTNDEGHESWASDILYRVFDMRLDKSTITTTNYNESKLKEKLGNNGARIIDRMLDNADGIRFDGDSYRRKKA